MADGFVGAYWGPRSEVVQESAERLEACLKSLSVLDSQFSLWFQKGRSASTARKEVATDASSLVSRFLRGRARKDSDNEVMPELGHSVSMWNGATNSVALSVLTGATNARVSNCVVLSTGDDLSVVGSADVEHATAILATLIQIWNPDWAVWSTGPLAQAQPQVEGVPDVGWLTYLPRGGVMLPAPTIVAPLAAGSLIIAGSTLHSTEIEAVRSIRRNLEAEGVLPPART